ncbi:hypothetical protein REJC140_02574 [Pseudorhizobium endolithicum]|uniref:DUF2799 domain-containing protein n=1 Tax=Pseudorhizobium endolithicum TaxID=1191678 RepID=A0ABN7JFC8_9HYPH|nr:DUF2799 domain-containing protein [Pseudorhizobium endolithicum]CAD7028020.1 hypothetical protein REJC140_02574 [Pseudorhizobium endolithicum]
MRYLPALGMAAVLMSLASCNTMSKEECRVADWAVVGDTDGAAGYDPQSRFADHVRSCSKSGSVPDQTRWYEGYQAGIRRFCTPLNGASTGEAGRTYHNVCPAETAADFMRGYSLGKRVHDLRSRINSLNSSVSSSEYEIDRLYDEMKKAADKDRRGIRDRIDDLERDRRRARRKADDLGYELSEAERDLAFFRQNPMAQLSPGY